MAKLFLFGIGGTGSRVIKHFTFLLSTGITLENTDLVIPIIIDPDKGNGDLNKTLNIIQLYNSIHNSLEFQHNKFFQTKIKTLHSIAKEIESEKASDVTEDNYFVELREVQSKKFQDFIELNTLNPNTESLCRLLFSEENLETELEVGFKGNPNMGSVVLNNQFTNHSFFDTFATSFDKDDRIFIISSIFGGTGAAGFPILLKNLRNPDPSIPKHEYIKNAVIGAITILPYFNLESDTDSKINSNTFISKTKASLKYYNDNIIKNQKLNVLYYVGDNENSTYKNSEGGSTQENKAHFIEFISALSIFDFMSISGLNSDKGRSTRNTITKEFGLRETASQINFTHLPQREREKIHNNMLQFFLMMRYFEDKLQADKDNKNIPWVDDTKLNLNDFVYNDMKKFMQYFKELLIEMQENRISFKPFKINEGNKEELFSCLEGIEPMVKKNFISLLKQKSDYESFTNSLNQASKKVPKDISNFKRLIALMYKATENIIKEKNINFN